MGDSTSADNSKLGAEQHQFVALLEVRIHRGFFFAISLSVGLLFVLGATGSDALHGSFLFLELEVRYTLLLRLGILTCCLATETETIA
jgi:hypothetical protein